MYSRIFGIVSFVVTFTLMVLMYHCFDEQGLIAWVAIGTIIANMRVTKAVHISGITATPENVMFASIYLATDILNDIYGRKIAKKTVRLGFSSTLIIIIVVRISLHFIPAPVDNTQDSLKVISDLVPKIVIGSIIAYIIGQHVDISVFSMVKKIFSSDKTFFIRTYGSTVLSSIIDTGLFVSIAFIGTIPGTVVFEMFVTTYLLKLVSAIFNVPFGYIAKSLYRRGKIEQLDNEY